MRKKVRIESFERIIVKIGSWGTVGGAVFISAVAVITVATVVGRAFHIALPGTFDLVSTLIVVGIAFALVYGQIEDRHLRTEIAIERLRGRVRTVVECFLGVLSIFYWIVLLGAAAKTVRDKWSVGEETDILNVPVLPFRLIWVLALILMSILLSMKLIHHIRGLIKGEGKK
jgi:TRAP-type C4-dicarboxylate transport system permease small subunit